MLMGDIIFKRIIVPLKFDLILLIDLLFEVFCLMFIEEIVIRVPEIHENQKDHDASDSDCV